jgi:FMN phosphatase YigB (HAD superfamily)
MAPTVATARALLLDLDNTLIDRDAAFLAWLDSLRPRAPELDIAALIALDRGGYGNKRILFTTLGDALGVSAARVRAMYEHELPTFVSLKRDAALLLDRFHGAKVVITNGPSALQRAKIRAAGLEGRVDAVLVSSELGRDKPHQSIFLEALSLARVTSAEAHMIGDHPVCDVLGARRVGIPASLLKTRWFGVPPGVASIDRLTEVAS